MVDQCAAFLTGTYRELLEAHGQPVPAWAWVNSLTHGGEDVVADLAAGPSRSDACVSYVARLARHAVVKTRTEGSA